MQIFENLHWVKGMGSNAYLFEDEDGWVLVDTGMPFGTDPIGYLAKLGHKADALKSIVITHADIDHIGGLHKVQAATGAKVYVGTNSAELIQSGKFPTHGSAVMDTISALMFRTKRVPDSALNIVKDGDEIPVMGGLQVIATPGHTPDHHSFFSPATGILFTGDAIVGFGGKIAPSSRAISHDYEQVKASALKLADLTPAIFVTGHGKPYLHEYDDLMDLFAATRAA